MLVATSSNLTAVRTNREVESGLLCDLILRCDKITVAHFVISSADQSVVEMLDNLETAPVRPDMSSRTAWDKSCLHGISTAREQPI